MPIDGPKAGETREQYLEYCIPAEIEAGYGAEQAAAICISIYDRDKMKGIKDTKQKVMARINYDTKFEGIRLQEGDGLEGACWDGYEAIGTKILDGREVPNCVPIKE
jgi:hypothetical protein